jgi:hypothetical protein
MNSADTWTAAIAFGVLMALILAIRDRLKRIEEKLDKLGK